MQSRSGSRYIITEELRSEIAANSNNFCSLDELLLKSMSKKIVAVGDVTTDRLKKAGIKLFMEVVDLKTKRNVQGDFVHIKGSLEVVNDPGTISLEMFNLIGRLIRKGTGGRIEVHGEEDLAVIPIIYYSGFDTVVAYGIPDKGLGCIDINPEIKGTVNKLVERMKLQ
ncbi:MAG: hypothetical protein B2I17_07105 [Thermoplasmatales archaeon B_DKE]|nr:MAG: hypothetical protein B2I17_07105 [Thermoplasmatales archaeon B_DKE]QRF76225.1 hypothetical protein Thermo_01742 [Thermoplasmatales archaeon]